MSNAEKTTTISVAIPTSLKEKIDENKLKTGTSISFFVVTAIQAAFDAADLKIQMNDRKANLGVMQSIPVAEKI